MKKKKSKRVVILSDLHCGHLVGLTPPRWHYQKDGKQFKIQKELWDWFAKEIDRLKPIDILIVNGDAIDGQGPKAGGTDQKTVDRSEQCEMAADVILYTGAPIVQMTYGTPYHTGNIEDWENVIIQYVKAENPKIKIKVESHAFLNINGIVFDIKHKIGGSQVPHTRFTPIAREKLWNTIWESRGEQQPEAGVLIRSHVHYFSDCGNHLWRAMTTPALQGYGSKYGARQCSGTVDIGFIVFDVEQDGKYSWFPVIAELAQQKAHVEHL